MFDQSTYNHDEETTCKSSKQCLKYPGTASFVDERDTKRTAPTVTIRVKTRLVLDLRRDWDDDAAILLPYPYDELSSYYFTSIEVTCVGNYNQLISIM